MTVYGALGGAGSGARDEQANISRLLVELREKIDREQKTFKKKTEKTMSMFDDFLGIISADTTLPIPTTTPPRLIESKIKGMFMWTHSAYRSEKTVF